MSFVRVGVSLLLIGLAPSLVYASAAAHFGLGYGVNSSRTLPLSLVFQQTKSRKGEQSAKKKPRTPRLSPIEIEQDDRKARPVKTWLIAPCTAVSEFRWAKGKVIRYAFEKNVRESWRIEFRKIAIAYNNIGADIELRESMLNVADYVFEAKDFLPSKKEKLGVTAYTEIPGSKILSGARTVINTRFGFFNWVLEADKWDIRTVIVHEIGHALGLGHSPCENLPMFEFLPPFERRDQVTEHEELGLLYIYGPRQPKLTRR